MEEFLQALRRGVMSHVTEALAHAQGLGKEASWADREGNRWGSCRWALAAHLDYCGGEGVRGGTGAERSSERGGLCQAGKVGEHWGSSPPRPGCLEAL